MDSKHDATTRRPRLPTELLLQVADGLDSSAAMSRFSRTSRLLYDYLQPKLYCFNVEQANCSAFYWAIEHDEPETAKMCLGAGASVDYANTRPCLYDSEAQHDEAIAGYSILFGYHGELGTTPLHEASARGSVKVMQVLLDHGADIDLEDKAQQSPLILASALGKDKSVAFLLDKGAHIQTEGPRNHSPLHSATCGGSTSTVQLLLDRGADPNRPSQYGHTPLYKAISYKRYEVAALLIKHGADIEAMASARLTPLRHAIDRNSSEMVSLLLAAGAEVNGPPMTRPLHEAVSRRNVSIVEALLKHGADVNAADEYSRMPIRAAVVAGDLKIVDLLVKYGADLGPGTSRPGRKAELLFTAVQCGRPEVIERLIDHGLDPFERNMYGQSAYEYAKDRGMEVVAERLRQYSGSRSKPAYMTYLSRRRRRTSAALEF